MVGRLEGKVAIVTGGGGGFGLGIVQKFVKEGAKVVIFDVNAEVGKKAEAAHTGTKFFKGDVSVKKDWENALDTAVKDFGKLDIVVNNAGILIIKVRFISKRSHISTVNNRVHRGRMGTNLSCQCKIIIPEQPSYYSILQGTWRGSLYQYI
jgi:NAD(P)-dependent dehydrogenase (short-subunit alcohol dehydrogenase family)